jgi:hypothetical protein
MPDRTDDKPTAPQPQRPAADAATPDQRGEKARQEALRSRDRTDDLIRQAKAVVTGV